MGVHQSLWTKFQRMIKDIHLSGMLLQRQAKEAGYLMWDVAREDISEIFYRICLLTDIQEQIYLKM